MTRRRFQRPLVLEGAQREAGAFNRDVLEKQTDRTHFDDSEQIDHVGARGVRHCRRPDGFHSSDDVRTLGHDLAASTSGVRVSLEVACPVAVLFGSQSKKQKSVHAA